LTGHKKISASRGTFQQPGNFTVEKEKCMNRQHELFRKHLLQEYQQEAVREQAGGQPEELIDFLVRRQLIPPVVQRRYVILREFAERYPRNGHHKSNTVLQMAMDLGVHENTVWTVLKDHSRDFDGEGGKT
jgi:hypothetical protein